MSRVDLVYLQLPSRLMQAPEFVRAYEAPLPEMNAIRTMIEAGNLRKL